MAKKGKKTTLKKKTTREKSKSTSPKSADAAAKKVKTVKIGKKKKTTKKVLKKQTKSYANTEKSKPPKSSRKSKKNRTHLTSRDLEYFRLLLMEKLHEILGDVDWIENEALRKSRQDSTGDLSTMPIHMADLGTDNYEQEFSLGLMDSERKIVQEILLALQRIVLGTYGLCEGTGQPIPRARLEANPWARYCVEYASLIEQGKAVEGQPYRAMDFGPDSEENEEEEEEDPKDLEHDEDDEEEDFLYDEEEEEEDEEEEGEDTHYTEGLYYEEDTDDEDDESF